MKKTFFLIFISFVAIASTNPLMAQSSKKKKTETVKISASMHCQDCADKIESELNFEPGIKKIVADYKINTVTIEFFPKKTNPDKIVEKIKSLGYSATLIIE